MEVLLLKKMFYFSITFLTLDKNLPSRELESRDLEMQHGVTYKLPELAIALPILIDGYLYK